MSGNQLVTPSPETLVSSVTHLASFPDVAFRISDMLSEENSSAADFGAVIEPDPALSAALLRMANSATYGIGRSVSNVEQAVKIVGLRDVRDLAFGICAAAAFEGIPNDLISVDDFWRHSLFCAAASQDLGRIAGISNGESLFTAGMLHDIGQLIMFNQCPELSSQALQLSLEENDGLLPYLSERKVFGFDHTAVGTELARQWQLPESLQQGIQYHHEPFASGQPSDAVAAIHVANSIAVLAEVDTHDVDGAPAMDERALAQLQLEPDVIPTIVATVRESVSELLRIFVK